MFVLCYSRYLSVVSCSQVELSYHRGGAGNSKVINPLHIKDDLCMCKEGVGGGGGGEVYNR